MAQAPITRNVALVWDTNNHCWRDSETQARVSGVPDPAEEVSAPCQSRGLPFTEEQWTCIKERINKVLTDRTAPDRPTYFVHHDWLVTYAQFSPEIIKRQQLETRIAQLEARGWRRSIARWLKAVLT